MWKRRADLWRHITPAQLKAAMPRCPDPAKWARAFDDAIEFFDVRDIAMLLAQVGHESADLTRLEENLNYTAKRITEVWPTRFRTIESAQPYARNPQALANLVYANRMGNGPPESGDGWRHRGQGPIQLTGKSNQRLFATAIDDDAPLKTPSLLQEPTYGSLSACWFYVKNVPNDADIETATRRINGGLHGLADRKRRYDIARKALEA